MLVLAFGSFELCFEVVDVVLLLLDQVELFLVVLLDVGHLLLQGVFVVLEVLDLLLLLKLLMGECLLEVRDLVLDGDFVLGAFLEVGPEFFELVGEVLVLGHECC